MKAGAWPRQEAARAVAPRFVTVLLPTGIFPLRGLNVSPRMRALGRGIACHCLSVPALMVRSSAAKVASKPLRSSIPTPPKPTGGSKTPQHLTEGAKAPTFRLPRDGGNTVSLADFSGKKLVLFFYPRADTPGCTREAIDFTRL